MPKIIDINQRKNRQRLIELSSQMNEAIKQTHPTKPYRSINIPDFIPPLPEWFLSRLDKEVSTNKDFLLITDSHYSHGERYINYQSLEGVDYDELIDGMLEALI